MNNSLSVPYDLSPPAPQARQQEGARTRDEQDSTFHDQFVALFDGHFARLQRVVSRLSGEPELAADVVQDAFVRLYRRGSLPDAPPQWLISVALNLFRNAASTRSRRGRLLTVARGEAMHSDAAPPPDHLVTQEESRQRVRQAMDRMPEREQRLLMLLAEGYTYREIAGARGSMRRAWGRCWRARSGSFARPTEMMPMHVDEERLQRLLHEELHAPDAAAIREHLVTCAECRARVEEARRDEDEVLTLLRDLDQPAVVVTAGDVTARARTHDARWLRAPWLRAAATIVLSAGLVGVAFAAPGSPLPRWFANLLVRVELQKSGERPPRERVRPQLAGSVAGISIEPGRELVVLFAESPARGEVVVSLFDGVEVEVRTAEGGARFTAGEERLVIDNRASSASFKVRIPRSARRVEMRLGSTRLLLKIGDRITAVVAPDSQGTYTIPLRAR